MSLGAHLHPTTKDTIGWGEYMSFHLAHFWNIAYMLSQAAAMSPTT